MEERRCREEARLAELQERENALEALRETVLSVHCRRVEPAKEAAIRCYRVQLASTLCQEIV